MSGYQYCTYPLSIAACRSGDTLLGMTKVRTRFPPSPTGYLHIGSARTALFNYLFARQHGGEFVLRIEDTDRERSTDEAVQVIMDSMEWMGLDYDEGPFFQTQRFDRYREVVNQLLDEGKAYRCYCTPDELTEMRELAMQKKEKPRYNGYWRDRTDTPPEGVDPVIRFKNPTTGAVVIDDAVKGPISVENSELDDLVIMRSDGTPTYNLCVVVDDMDMEITHVIRGDDHVNNTPRQINIFNALGATLPVFAHLPMILGEDGKRMSKRHGAVSVMQYAEDGYLRDALMNHLVRLGWSHGDQEVFSMDEMMKLFGLDHVNKSGAVFDVKKLDWLNQQYMQTASVDTLAAGLTEHLERAEISTDAGPSVAEVAKLLRDRAKTFGEMAEGAKPFYEAPSEYDEKAAKKQFSADAGVRLQKVHDNLAALEDFTAEAIDACLQETVAELEVGFGKIGLPLRVAVTGNTASPALDQTLAVMGQKAVLDRLVAAVQYCQSL